MTLWRQLLRQRLCVLGLIFSKIEQRTAYDRLGLGWRRWCRVDLEGRIKMSCGGLKDLLDNERSHLATSRVECRSLSQKLATAKQELSVSEAKFEKVRTLV